MDILLDKTEPNKSGDKWYLSIIAVVKEGKKLIENEEVTFDINNAFYDKKPTNNEGRVSIDLLLDGGKAHTISARLKDGKEKKMVITLKGAESKKAEKLLLETIGTNIGSTTEYLISIQVLAKEDSPLAGVIIRILDKETTGGFYDLSPTDKQGVVTEKIIVSGKEKLITVLVLGTALSEWKNLYNQN